ncbi:MAG: glycosyltransferase family 39 protein [Anaerolineae bacterium]
MRVPGLSFQSLWRDEVDAIRFSNESLPELLRGMARAGHNGPLYFLILRGWRALTGDTEFALRFFSAAWGVLMVPLVYVVARRLRLSRGASSATSLLVATAPYLIWYSQEAKMYTLLAGLVLLALAAYLTALRGGSAGWWVIFTVAASLSLYTHILATLALVVYGLLAPIYWLLERPDPKPIKGWSLSIACLTLPYVPLAIWQFPLLRQALQNGLDTGHRFYPLPDQVRLLLGLYNRGVVYPPFEPSATILSLFLLLAGLFLGTGSRRRSGVMWRRSVLLVWLGLPVLLAFFVSRRAPVFEDRYLIYIAPAYYMLIALGVLGTRRYSRPLALGCLGAFIAINLWGVWRQATLPIKADFRAAAAFIEERVLAEARPAVMLQIPYLQYTFDYYFQPEFKLVEGIWTNDGRSPDAVAAEMQTRLDDVEHVWLVVSEEEMWDRRGLTRGWLEEHARLVEEAHFRRVDVYQYLMD